MNFLNALQISASGLSAQRARMDVITSNLANANTTSTAEGGPYKRKDVIFGAYPLAPAEDFSGILGDTIGKGIAEVRVVGIATDQRPPLMKYIPEHPQADQNGYVAMPNINVVEEVVDMMMAARSYEANLTAIQTTKSMAMKALEIGK